MKNLQQISTAVENMRKGQSKVKQTADALKATVEKIKQDNTRHPNYIAEKAKEARDKTMPVINDAIDTAQKEHDALMQHEQFYKNTAFYLSQKSLTEPLLGINGAPQKDPGIEAGARMAKMMELGKMDTNTLRLAANNAKLEGNLAELSLIAQEYSSRGNEDPILFDDVPMPERDQALSLFGEASSILGDMIMTFHDASGNPLTPIQRINYARGILPGREFDTPTGTPQDRMTAARQ